MNMESCDLFNKKLLLGYYGILDVLFSRRKIEIS